MDQKDQSKENDWVCWISEKASYTELKRKAKNRKEWRTWKPRTCLTAEH